MIAERPERYVQSRRFGGTVGTVTAQALGRGPAGQRQRRRPRKSLGGSDQGIGEEQSDGLGLERPVRRGCTLVPAQGDLPQIVLVQINLQAHLATAPAGAKGAHSAPIMLYALI